MVIIKTTGEKMTNQEISRKIKIIKENYVNGNINSEDMMEHLDDLCCELEECEGAFGMGFEGDEDHYDSFEETDFTKLEIA